jgi:hypothetical protein
MPKNTSNHRNLAGGFLLVFLKTQGRTKRHFATSAALGNETGKIQALKGPLGQDSRKCATSKLALWASKESPN